jgi:hypothetical protein
MGGTVSSLLDRLPGRGGDPDGAQDTADSAGDAGDTDEGEERDGPRAPREIREELERLDEWEEAIAAERDALEAELEEATKANLWAYGQLEKAQLGSDTVEAEHREAFQATYEWLQEAGEATADEVY